MAIFHIKNSDIFHVSAQNIDCGYSLEPPRRGGSNEYPHSMFLSKNNKNNVYPWNPQFYYIKWGLRGSKLYRYVFVMKWHLSTQLSVQIIIIIIIITIVVVEGLWPFLLTNSK